MNIEYFFRSVENSNYKPSRILMAICIIMVIVAFNFSIRKTLTKRQSKVISLILIISQISILVWFTTIRKLPLVDSLPLYYCRISAIVIPIGILLNRNHTKVCNYFASFSVFGATIALMCPDMEKYNFPHLTNVSYIVIHTLLLILALYIVKTETEILRKRTILAMTMDILLPIHVINLLFKTNYSYTMHLPSVLKIVPTQLSIFVIVIMTLTAITFVQRTLKPILFKK